MVFVTALTQHGGDFDGYYSALLSLDSDRTAGEVGENSLHRRSFGKGGGGTDETPSGTDRKW